MGTCIASLPVYADMAIIDEILDKIEELSPSLSNSNATSSRATVSALAVSQAHQRVLARHNYSARADTHFLNYLQELG